MRIAYTVHNRLSLNTKIKEIDKEHWIIDVRII